MSDSPYTHLEPSQVVEIQRAKWAGLVQAVRATNSFYQQKHRNYDPRSGNIDFRAIPFTTRAEVEADQLAQPPYGTNLTYSLDKFVRLHQTSGTSGTPVRWLDTAESWAWWKKCWDWVYHGASVGPSDRLMFAFSFGPFIGFWSAFETASELGMFCLTAGGMSSLARIQFLIDHRATVVCCTPTYAMRLAEIARENGIDLRNSSVTKLIVAGEPGGSIPSTRARIEEAWGARLFDHAGMTEVGAWGYECTENPSGMHIIETEFVAEVIDPQSTQPVGDGEVGELVLTNLGRTGSPLVRYRTGDLVRLVRGKCACGSSFARVEGGVLGRVDGMIIVRGNNVFPSAVEGFVREFDEVAEFNIVVGDEGAMAELELVVEPLVGADSASLVTRMTEAFRNRFHFVARVRAVASGSLPRFDMKARRVVRREDIH